MSIRATIARAIALSLSLSAPIAQQPATPETPKSETPKPDLTKAKYAWEKLTTEPYPGKQDDIVFINPDVGWYVNGSGHIYKTTDAGKTWAQQFHHPGTFFRCVAFADEQRGWAGNVGPDYYPGVTDDTPLYETSDGGTTWTPVAGLAGDKVKGLCALEVVRGEGGATRIVGAGRVGGPPSFIMSDDLGKTWKQIDVAAQCGAIFDVHFTDLKHGFLAAATDADPQKSHALVLATSDAGTTWTKAYESQRPWELTWKLSFPTASTGYVTIQSYNPSKEVTARFVAKTTDAGKTWTELPLTENFKVREFGVAFLDEKVGWVGATPFSFETLDGGATWTPCTMGNAVNKVRVLKTPTGFVAYAIGVDVRKLVGAMP